MNPIHEQIQNELKKKGSDLQRLLAWLQQPKQGILPQVAISVITEICLEEFQKGHEWYLEPLMYSEGLRKAMAKGRVPDTYWVEMYILERCRWIQEDMLAAEGLDIDLVRVDETLEELITRIKYFNGEIAILRSELSEANNYLTLRVERLFKEMNQGFEALKDKAHGHAWYRFRWFFGERRGLK